MSVGALAVPVAIVAAIAVVIQQRTIAALRESLREANLALSMQIARRQGEQRLRDLMADWHRHVEMEGLEFADGDEAAHAFADFLANQTGQAIIAQQLGGDGVIVAIPDPQQEAT